MTLLLVFIIGTGGFSAWFVKLTYATPFFTTFLLVTSGLFASVLFMVVAMYVIEWTKYGFECLTEKKTSKPCA
ncbi:MAG: hypothetical protein NUV54_03645 [Candidatus Taylorbacteria bacterium]|nr:hypothetical protein [Candidatus Taylorbacteria bacterium]